MKLKKRYLVMIALFLAILMASESPAKVLAESKPQYIKEVRVSWDMKDGTKAKKWLTDHGYQVVDQDLNAGTGEGYSYLGYKTTTNKDEAVTDISMMDMKGGFETMNYRSMAEKNAPNAKQMATEMMAACQEFRDNLKAGSPEAKVAKAILDLLIVEEDNNRPLGDYLLDESRRVGDFYDIILMGNSLITTYIYNQLTMGTADYQKDNWMKRLSDMGPAVSEREESKWKDYDAEIMQKAGKLKTTIQTFSKNYRAAKTRQKNNNGKVVTPKVSSEQDADAEAKKLAEGKEIQEENQDILYLSAYETLKKYKYGDSNLGDIFVKWGKGSVSAVKFYSLTKSLTEGQYAMMRVTGMVSAVMATNNTEEACKDAWEKLPEMKQEMTEAAGGKQPTLWTGTNLSVYKKQVALTREASRTAAASGTYDALTKESNIKVNLRLVMMQAGYIGLGAVGVALLTVGGTALFFGGTSVAVAAVALYTSIGTTIGSTIVGIVGLAAPVALAVLVAAVILVAAVWYGVIALIDLYDYYHPEYTSIPTDMYDYESKYFIGYEVVLDQNGKAADLNNWEGKEWNALYVSKDTKAGSPIVADDVGKIFTVKKGGDPNVPRGYEPLTKFGENVPANTNDHAYKDKENGIYLFYHTEEAMAKASLNPGEVVIEDDAGKTRYIESVMLASKNTEEAAKLFLNNKKYTPIDFNLTAGQKMATYIGYKTTTNETEAIRDIRVAYGADAGDKYTWGSAGYTKAGSVNKISLYYSAYSETGDPILADMVVTDSLSKKPKGYEPVNLFCGGEAYNINIYDEEDMDDWSQRAYIFFHPSVEYTSGTKYLSGYVFVGGADYGSSYFKHAYQLSDYISELGLVDTGMDMNENCHYFDYSKKMKLCYTTTYNPHRAIYDVKLHEGEVRAQGLAGNVVYDGRGYSACEVLTQLQDSTEMERYRKFRDTHAYLSANEDEGAYDDELLYHDKYYLNKDIESKVQCRGLYVQGPIASSTAKPLTEEDIKFQKGNSSCPSGYVSVKYMSDVYNTSSVNLGMGKHDYEHLMIPDEHYSGSFVYMFLKGQEKKKEKYIQSIQVVYSDTKTMSKDMCMYRLYGSGGDEIIDFNLASYTGAAELDDDYEGKNMTHQELKKSISELEYDDDYKDRSAYIRVTRTDDRNMAIQDVMLYKVDKKAVEPPEKVTRNGATYRRCGDKITGPNGMFYLYTSYIGSPITDLRFSRMPISNGWTTALDQYDQADSDDPWWLQTKSDETKTYIKSVGVTSSSSSKPTKQDLCDLLSQGCTDYVLDFNFNYNAGNTKIFIGYGRTNKKSEAICDLIAYHENFDQRRLYSNGKWFYRVGNVELNKRVGGDYIWLYYTKDTRAGSPITDLHGSSYRRYVEYGKNYELLMRNDGGVSDLNAGVKSGVCESEKDYRCYLHINRYENKIKPGASSSSSVFTEPKLVMILVMALLMLGIGGGVIIVRKRKRKKQSLLKKGEGMMLLILLLAAGWLVQSKPAQAAGAYISDVELAVGDEARYDWEDKGYTTLPQCLNLVEQNEKKGYNLEGKARIYLTYQTATDENKAVTDLIIANRAEKTMKHQGITYTLLSDTSLNEGVDGENIYLYYTKDKKAGDPIVDFDFSAYQKNSSADFSGYALNGDGAAPVRTTEGAAANLDEGRDGIELYLFLIRDNLYRPYIREVHVASAASKRAAVKKIAALGCDYYVTSDLNSGDGTYVLLGYQRTSEKKEAITGLMGSKEKKPKLQEGGVTYTMAEDVALRGKVGKEETVSYYLYSTKEESAGNPVIDFAVDSEEKEKKVIYGEWVSAYFGGKSGMVKVYTMQEKAYQEALEDQTEFIKQSIMVLNKGEQIPVNLAVLQSDKPLSEDLQKEKEEKEEKEEEASASPAATAEPEQTEKTKETEEEKSKAVSGSAVTGDKEGAVSASALSEGNLVSIVAVVILILAALAGACIFRRRK